MLLPNCIEAVLFDQAALANALTPVPLHAIDTPKSSAYILNDSGAEVLVTNKKLKWRLVREAAELVACQNAGCAAPAGAALDRSCSTRLYLRHDG